MLVASLHFSHISTFTVTVFSGIFPPDKQKTLLRMYHNFAGFTKKELFFIKYSLLFGIAKRSHPRFFQRFKRYDSAIFTLIHISERSEASFSESFFNHPGNG